MNFYEKINLSFIILFAFVISLYIFLKPKKQSQPNIVLIFTDDQGYGDLSSYGSETIYTPHLDALTKRGKNKILRKIVTLIMDILTSCRIIRGFSSYNYIVRMTFV